MANFKAVALGVLLAFSTVSAVLPAPVSATALGWTQPDIMGGVDQFGSTPGAVSVAIGINGRALAAWDDWFAPMVNYAVYYRWYSVETGWGDGGVLFNSLGDQARAPAVAASRNGDFMIVYESNTPGYALVQAYWYDASSDLFTTNGAANQATPAFQVGQPAVGMDNDGNAIVLWNNHDGTFNNLTASRFTAGAGWDSSPDTLDVLATSSTYPRLAVDPSGNAIATWIQDDGMAARPFASRYLASGAWSAPVQIDAGSSDAYNPTLAMDAQGNAQALWVQINGSTSDLYASGFTNGGGWSAPVQVSSETGGSPSVVRAAGGPAGTFAAAWTQGTSADNQMMASTYTGGIWTTPTNLSAGVGSGGAMAGHVGIDAQGNALVVWNQYGAEHPVQVWGAWSGGPTGWQAAQRLDTSTGRDATLLGLGTNAVGWTLGFWKQNDGSSYDLWSSFYAHPDVTPPPLSVISPIDGAIYEDPVAQIYGDTAGGITKVYVNGMAVAVNDFGEFMGTVPLSRGNNTITVTVIDHAGNVATAYRYVTYVDPVPALQAEIAAAQADADAAAAEAEEAHTVAHATEIALNATQVELAAAQTALVTAQSQLTATQAALAAQSATDASQTAATNSAAAAAGSGMLFGILGLVVALAGIGMGFMMSRRATAKRPAASPPEAKPPTPP